MTDRPIDYARMKRVFPTQKAALTRALRTTDPEQRRERVLDCTRKAVVEWNAIGAWPDDWARWQRALSDVYPGFEAPDMQSWDFA